VSGAAEDIGVRSEVLLLLVLVALFGGVTSANDTEAPGRSVLYIETPEGQLAWPVAGEDEIAFGALPAVDDYPWDGHSPEVRHRRLCRLIGKLPKMTYARPMYGFV
jgi:hypothetical protein